MRKRAFFEPRFIERATFLVEPFTGAWLPAGTVAELDTGGMFSPLEVVVGIDPGAAAALLRQLADHLDELAARNE